MFDEKFSIQTDLRIYQISLNVHDQLNLETSIKCRTGRQCSDFNHLRDICVEVYHASHFSFLLIYNTNFIH